MDTVYIIVSVEPKSTDAAKPENPSAPDDEKSSFTVAVAPLPDIGLIIITGIISEGMPKRDKSGVAAVHTASSAPEADSILTATTRRRRVGNTDSIVLRPSLQPVRKSEKRSSFDIAGIIAHTVIINGSITQAIFSAFTDVSSVYILWRTDGI